MRCGQIGRRVGLALGVALASACATTGGTARPSPFPHAPMPVSSPAPLPAPPPSAGEPVPAPAREEPPGKTDVLQTALGLRGIPYREGGTDLHGFDCSGFVQYVFQQHQIALPRTVAQQYVIGHRVKLADLAPGDLVFFTTVRPGASHVGIAVGDGTFVHAPVSGGVIRLDRLDSPYWQTRALGATRVTTGDAR